MTHPFQAVEIVLPTGVDLELLPQLEEALSTTAGVDQCGRSTPRSLDPGAITVWVTLAASVIAAAGAAVPVVKQIIELFRNKGIKGAKLVLSNGTVVEADNLSVDDLAKLARG